MRVIAFVLAAVLFVLGILYWLGKVNWFTESGTLHPHHTTHAIALWVLALLCLIFARFQSSPQR